MDDAIFPFRLNDSFRAEVNMFLVHVSRHVCGAVKSTDPSEVVHKLLFRELIYCVIFMSKCQSSLVEKTIDRSVEILNAPLADDDSHVNSSIQLLQMKQLAFSILGDLCVWQEQNGK